MYLHNIMPSCDPFMILNRRVIYQSHIAQLKLITYIRRGGPSIRELFRARFGTNHTHSFFLLASRYNPTHIIHRS
jgi:hypothetical protein